MIIDKGVTYQQTYEAMEGLKRAGLIRHIGISNVGTSMIREVIAYATEKPDSLQVEMHPFLSQERLLRMAQEEGMQVMAYSNFGAISYVPIGLAQQDSDLLHHSVINAIGTAKGKTAAQVLLRWAIQRNTICIPKSSSEARLIENICVFDWTLTDEEMGQISALNKNERYNDPGTYGEGGFGCFCPIFD